MKKLLLITALSFSLQAEISFREHLAPILKNKCESCHGDQKKKGGYGVDTFAKFMKAGKSGFDAIVPKDPEDSYVYELLISDDEDERMPQKDDPLSKEEISLFKQWISEGAKFDGESEEDKLITLLPPPVHPKPPEVYPTKIPILNSVFSPDGQKIYSSAYNEVLIWDLDGKLIDRIQGLPQAINAIVFSVDKKGIYVAGGAPGEYGEISYVNLKTMKVSNIAMCEDVVLSLKLAPKQNYLIAGGADSNIRVFDLKDNQLLWRNKQHAHWVTDLAVTDYSYFEAQAKNEGLPEFLVFTEFEKIGGEHARQLWKFEDRTIIREANWQLEFSDSEDLKLSDIRETGIGKTREVKEKHYSGDQIAKHQQVVDYLRVLSKNWGDKVDAQAFLITSSFDKTVKVFNIKTGLLFTTYKGHSKVYGKVNGHFKVYSVITQKDSQLAWSAGGGKHIHGWDPVKIRDEDGTAGDMEARFAKEGSAIFLKHNFKKKKIFEIKQQNNSIWAVADDGSIKQFKIPQDGKFNADHAAEVFTSQIVNDYLMSLDISNNKIITAGYDGTINKLNLSPVEKKKVSFQVSGLKGNNGQKVEQTIDGNVNSKWCFKHDNEPIVWTATYSTPASIQSYSLSSAGDVPKRDPKDWLLEASNDGKNWTIIDQKSDQPIFKNRRMTRNFSLAEETPKYKQFRLSFTKVNGDSHFQLSEIKLNQKDKSPLKTFVAYPQ